MAIDVDLTRAELELRSVLSKLLPNVTNPVRVRHGSLLGHAGWFEQRNWIHAMGLQSSAATFRANEPKRGRLSRMVHQFALDRVDVFSTVGANLKLQPTTVLRLFTRVAGMEL